MAGGGSSRPRTAAKAGSGGAGGDSHDGLMTSVSLGVRARVGGPGAHDRLVRGIGGEPLGAEAGELLEQRSRRARAGLQRFQRGQRPLLAPLAALRVEQQLGVGRGWWQRFRRRLERVRREQGAQGAALLLVQSLRCPLGRVASLLLDRVRQLHRLGLKRSNTRPERLIDGSGGRPERLTGESRC